MHARSFAYTLFILLPGLPAATRVYKAAHFYWPHSFLEMLAVLSCVLLLRLLPVAGAESLSLRYCTNRDGHVLPWGHHECVKEYFPEEAETTTIAMPDHSSSDYEDEVPKLMTSFSTGAIPKGTMEVRLLNVMS